MNRLIKNEFIKILHKKSNWIILFVILGYITLITYIYSKDYQIQDSNYTYNEQLKAIQEELNLLKENMLIYKDDKIMYSVYENMYNLLETYQYSPWKKDLIYNLYQEASINYYNELYGKKGKKNMEYYHSQIENYIHILKKDDWKGYVTILNNNASNKIEKLKSENSSKSTQMEIDYLKYTINLNQYRIDNNVEFNGNYIDQALNKLLNEKSIQMEYQNKSDLTKQENEKLNSLNEDITKNEYIINNKLDIESKNTLRNILIEFFNEYAFLIIIFIVLISSSTVGDEFQKGTIKSLLTVPYTRTEIILSKILSVIILTFLIVILLILYQIFIGGIILGFDTLKIPVLIYQFKNNTLLAINIFKFLFIIFLSYLPYFIFFMLISICIAILINNTGFSITISFFINLSSSIINAFAIELNIKFMRYFPTMNWNFMEYLFGAKPKYLYADLKVSIIMYIVYVVMLLNIIIITFKNKNIKNN